MQAPWDTLLTMAAAVRENAYAPYSHFRVGAVAVAADGSTFAGCNVENAAYGPSLCAERNAIGQLIAQGHKRVAAIAIVTDAEKATPPCGTCRQVMAEFAAADMPVVMRTLKGDEARYTLGELLPHSFNGDFL